jgi:uncharacterized protein (DUF1697 family)
MPRGGRAGAPETYVALLRGINLGARNKVAMPDLRALFGALGAQDVSTYVQSGNVVFKSPEGPAELRAAAEEHIKRDLGLDVTVLLRTRTELAAIVADNPFARDEREPTTLHVTFLAEAPDAERARELDPTASDPDEFRIVGRDVYLHCPNGYGRSKLSNAFFERRLGVAATTRNWRTVTTLAELSGTRPLQAG